MVKFLVAAGLSDRTRKEGEPWTWEPSTPLDKVRQMTKPVRRAFVADPSNAWQVYSCVAGQNPHEAVTASNPPAELRGVVLDYDVPVEEAELGELVDKLSLPPTFCCRSLSLRAHLVWVLEKPLYLSSPWLGRAFVEEFFKHAGVKRVLRRGLDAASERLTMMWTNGADWFESGDAVPEEVVAKVAIDACSRRRDDGAAPIPLERIAAKVAEDFPNRWDGEFTVGALGPRFWDETADNHRGCQVKPDGMLCFSGPEKDRYKVKTWAELFGAEWVDSQRTAMLEPAVRDIFHDGRSYWMRLGDRFLDINEAGAARKLKVMGLSGEVNKKTGETSSEVDRALNHIQENNRVEFVAPMHFHPRGLTTYQNERVLNTSTLKALPPAEVGSLEEAEAGFPFIRQIIWGQFGDDVVAREHFLARLQVSYRALLELDHVRSQALFICGPKDCGKTLIVDRVITPLLGGRSAKIMDYLMGLTPFNAEMFDSLVLAFHDERPPQDENQRKTFEMRLRGLAVNPDQMYHAKFRKASKVPWAGLIVTTLNDDPEAVSLLPEVHENTEDKLSFFHVRHPGIQWPDVVVTEQRITSELPFFAAWLLRWEPTTPGIYIGGRMRVRSYHDPEVLDMSSQQTQAHNVLELLAAVMSPSGVMADFAEWQGSPTELHAQISLDEGYRNAAYRTTPNSLSKALMSLSRRPGTGVEYLHYAGKRTFKLSRNLIVRAFPPSSSAK